MLPHALLFSHTSMSETCVEMHFVKHSSMRLYPEHSCSTQPAFFTRSILKCNVEITGFNNSIYYDTTRVFLILCVC